MKKAFSILLIFFSAMMLFPCAYADITAGLIYDEVDNTWAAMDEDLAELAGIMKRECTKSPQIKGTYILATDDRIVFIGGINSSDIHGNKVDAYQSVQKAFHSCAAVRCKSGSSPWIGWFAVSTPFRSPGTFR